MKIVSSACKVKVFFYLLLSIFCPRSSICLYRFRFGASGWLFSYKGSRAGQSIIAAFLD